MTGQIFEAYVASDSDLTGLVADRVRPMGADTGDALPYLTYQEIDSATFPSLNGPSGICDRRLQVNVVSASYGQAKLIARYLCGTGPDGGDPRFDGFKGTLNGIDVRRVRLEDMRDGYDEPVSGQGRGTYEIQLDFMVAFDDAALTAASAGG